MSRFSRCNCPAGAAAAGERHAPDCPSFTGMTAPMAAMLAVSSRQPRLDTATQAGPAGIVCDNHLMFGIAHLTEQGKALPHGTALYCKEHAPAAIGTAIAVCLPDDDIDVVIYTEGTDFAREQFFHVRGSDLNPAYYDAEHQMREECQAATHWIAADDLAALLTGAGIDRSGELEGDQ